MRIKGLLWPVFFIAHWLACGLLAWHLLAQVNFAYPQAYQLLDMGPFIARFAPQNRYRDGFATTDKAQRFAIFSQIVDAIQGEPQKLAHIRYTTHKGTTHPLLRPPEIEHLTDVARLVRGIYWLGIGAAIVAFICLLLLRYQRVPLPRPAPIIGGFIAVIALAVAAIISIGPTAVFYHFHTWIFPANHAWFFYYQDSLMTTLMKAPDLFGFIAVLMLIIWLALWLPSLLLTLRLWRDVDHANHS